MDLMSILNVVLTGIVIVLLALCMIMACTFAMGKIMSFASTYKKVGSAQKAAEKSA